MIYVGIGSLQCSGELRDIFPIMVDSAGNVTVVNTRANLSWHMRTIPSRSVFWVGPLYNYTDDAPSYAVKKLLDLKKQMLTDFNRKPKTDEDD